MHGRSGSDPAAMARRTGSDPCVAGGPRRGEEDDDEDDANKEAVMPSFAELCQMCSEMREELLMHREVLERCLEVRETCMGILEHREELMQCLQLRQAMDTVMTGAQIVNEIGDRTAELDLSIAGVADNTARHGKAISSLAEDQKRTSATLDAVVRAVKRLDCRSRSRNRSAGPAGQGLGYAARGREASFDGAAMRGPPLDFAMAAEPEHLSEPARPSAASTGHSPGPASRFGGKATAHVAPVAMDEEEDWEWSAWPRATNGGVGNDDKPRCISESSSCASSNANGKNRIGSSGRAAYSGRSGGASSSSGGRRQSGGTGAAKMDTCVRGVLARIEEALTKLDDRRGPPAPGAEDRAGDFSGVTTTPPPARASMDPDYEERIVHGLKGVNSAEQMERRAWRGRADRGPDDENGYTPGRPGGRRGAAPDARGCIDDDGGPRSRYGAHTPRGDRAHHAADSIRGHDR